MKDAADLVLLDEWLYNKNEDALTTIMHRYRGLIFSIVVKIVKHEGEAQDVVQDIFMETLVTKVGNFDRTRYTLKSWLLLYARTRGLDHKDSLTYRKVYRTQELSDWSRGSKKNRLPSCFCSVSLNKNELKVFAGELLGTLKNPHQKIVRLVIEGHTLQEAARETGCTFITARNYYRRSILKFQKIIAGEKIEKQKISSPKNLT